MPTERTPSANFPKGGRPPIVPKARIAERATVIAEALFQASHLDPALDAVAVNELARLCVTRKDWTPTSSGAASRPGAAASEARRSSGWR